MTVDSIVHLIISCCFGKEPELFTQSNNVDPRLDWRALMLCTECFYRLCIGNCRNVKGLGKSMVVFRFFEKLTYSNGRSTKFESLYQE